MHDEDTAVSGCLHAQSRRVAPVEQVLSRRSPILHAGFAVGVLIVGGSGVAHSKEDLDADAERPL